MAVNMVGDMAVNVIAPNGSWINVFDLETTFELKFEVRFRSCLLAEPALSLTGAWRFGAQLYFANGSQAVHGKFYIASFTTVIKVRAIGWPSNT